MNRVVITGASGFIGANLTRRLLREGHETHLLLRPTHQPWRLEGILNHVHFHEAALEDREAVSRAIHGIRPQWVFNLAAYGAYPSQTGIERMVSTNLLGCAALVDACAQVGVEAFVQAGSSSEYGYKDHAAREDELVQPNSHYAITKVAATHYCQVAARLHGLNIVTVRLYSIYGPYEEPTRLIPTLIGYGMRGQFPPLVSPWIARDFVHVDDAVEAILQVAAMKPSRGGAVYNICSGMQSRLDSVVAIVRKLMNVAAEPVWASMQPRSWDTDTWLGSPDLMARQVGWRSKLDLEAGLRITIDWFKDNSKWLDLYINRIFQV
jgi:dolichol-phosphate mannosyltransferase